MKPEPVTDWDMAKTVGYENGLNDAAKTVRQLWQAAVKEEHEGAYLLDVAVDAILALSINAIGEE